MALPFFITRFIDGNKTQIGMNRNKELNLEKNRKELKINSQIETKLQKLYLLNEKNPQKVNDNLMGLIADEELILTSYKKLRTDKRSMTLATTPAIVVDMNLTKLRTLSQTLLDGTFKWSNVNKQTTSKPEKLKKYPSELFNVCDWIVQENIRVILNVIYEPQFQEIETNHGLRSKRSPKTAITRLQHESKEMSHALTLEKQNIYDNLDHKRMIQILKRKISDNKFLSLIERGLTQNVVFEKKKYLNIVSPPNAKIASSILFNIYLHEFDRYLTQRLKHISTHLNEIEGRCLSEKYAKYYPRTLSRVKREKFKISSKSIDNFLIRFAYSRYANNWIILTNGKRKLLENLKDEIIDFFLNDLKIKLNEDKISVRNLRKDKAKYLGFTIFYREKRIRKERVFRQRLASEPIVGIDHERILSRLVAEKILSEKYLPRSNPTYVALKPYDIVIKYKQRLEKLFDYYYLNVTYPNELSRYYYAYKFSCLKTLARRMKISISQVTMKYGERMEVFLEAKFRRKNSLGLVEVEKVKKKEIARFPTHKEIHKLNFEQKKKSLSARYLRVKTDKQNFGLEPLTLKDYLAFSDFDYKTFLT